MRRRLFLTTAVAAAGVTTRGWAQTASLPSIGFLVAGDPEPAWSMFRKAMTSLGHIDGRTIKLEYRVGAGAQLDELASELVRLKVLVIVAVLTPAIAAAKSATSTIPIAAMGGAPDTGLVKNMARPEGNITGVFSPGTMLAGKGVQLFHEIRPEITSFGVVLNGADPFHVPLLRDVEAVTRSQKLELVQAVLQSGDELAAALDVMVKRGVGGVLIHPSLGLDKAAALALERRLPAISHRREFAERGGLMSYGADFVDLSRILARQVDQLMKGAKPESVPMQQATRFELVVNRRTARELGITLPPMFLARVDEFVE